MARLLCTRPVNANLIHRSRDLDLDDVRQYERRSRLNISHHYRTDYESSRYSKAYAKSKYLHTGLYLGLDQLVTKHLLDQRKRKVGQHGDEDDILGQASSSGRVRDRPGSQSR